MDFGVKEMGLNSDSSTEKWSYLNKFKKKKPLSLSVPFCKMCS